MSLCEAYGRAKAMDLGCAIQFSAVVRLAASLVSSVLSGGS
jgi:hypothetical protein